MDATNNQPNVTPEPAQAATPAAPQAATPTETEQAIARALETKDLKALAELAANQYAEIKTVRSESASRKDELRELKEKVTQFEQAQEQARLAEMNEIERLKEQNRLLEERAAQERNRAELAFAENAFIQAGAHDTKSLLLHYKELPADQRSKTDPAAWVEQQKQSLPHLFRMAADPAPAAPVEPKVLATTGRPNNPTTEPNRAKTDLGKGSSPADRNRAWQMLGQGKSIV